MSAYKNPHKEGCQQRYRLDGICSCGMDDQDILSRANQIKQSDNLSTIPCAAEGTEEALWHDPDWVCPHCQSVNMAIRGRCRICGFDSEVTHAGCC